MLKIIASVGLALIVSLSQTQSNEIHQPFIRLETEHKILSQSDFKPVSKAKAVIPKSEAKKPPERISGGVVSTSNCTQLRNRLRGLGVKQLDQAIFIAQKESGCRSSAVNPSSGACGEFQSLPCGKWGSPGTDEYLRNAISYADNRYNGWLGAYNFWQANHWW